MATHKELAYCMSHGTPVWVLFEGFWTSGHIAFAEPDGFGDTGYGVEIRNGWDTVCVPADKIRVHRP